MLLLNFILTCVIKKHLYTENYLLSYIYVQTPNLWWEAKSKINNQYHKPTILFFFSLLENFKVTPNQWERH